MSWEYRFSKLAIKQIKAIAPNHQRRIKQALDILVNNPYLKNNNIKVLTGELKGYYRLRIGRYRVVYSLDNILLVLFIELISKRDEKTYM